MQLFSVNATIFFFQCFLPLKTGKKLLKSWQPQFFFSVLPTGPKPAQISFSVP